MWFFFGSGRERRPKFTDVAEAAGWGELQKGSSDWLLHSGTLRGLDDATVKSLPSIGPFFKEKRNISID
jgi:hypothetical protein